MARQKLSKWFSWLNSNNSNLRSSRYSVNRVDPFNPEFNAFYPMRRSKADAFEFFDDENIFNYGITRLLLKLRERIQLFDEMVWTSRRFRFCLIVALSALTIGGILMCCFVYPGIESALPSQRLVLVMILIFFAYLASFLKGNSQATNNDTNASNFRDGRKSKIFTKTVRDNDRYKKILQTYLPSALRTFCFTISLTIVACRSDDRIRVISSLCVVLGILVYLFSCQQKSKEQLCSVLTISISALFFACLMLKSGLGNLYTFYWYNFLRTYSQELQKSLTATLRLNYTELEEIPSEYYLVFYNPFFVAIAAMLFHMGCHKFLLKVWSQLGIFFFRTSAVVMGCFFSAQFFDSGSYLLWMSPLLSLVTDHQIMLIIVSIATCIPLPLSFSIAHRYGLRYPLITTFGPINMCVALAVVKCISPCKGSHHLKLNMNLFRKRENTDFFETVTVAIANTAKFLLISLGGYVIGSGMNKFCISFKMTCDELFRKTFLGATFVDDVVYVVKLPIVYLLGFPERDIPVVSKFLFRNFIIFNTEAIDELMHHVGLRWITECWSSHQWHSVEYDNDYVYFKSFYENTLFFKIRGPILEEKTEFLLMHWLLNNVTVTHLFTLCSIMALVLPHKIVNIRAMMGNMFAAMFLALIASNVLIHSLYKRRIGGLWCINEKHQPLCTAMIHDIAQKMRFNGSVFTFEENLSFICHDAIKGKYIFGDESMSVY